MAERPPQPRPPALAEARLVAGYLRFWRVLDRLVRAHVLPVLADPTATPERRDAAPRTLAELKAAALAAVDDVRIAFAKEVDGAAVAELCAKVGGQIDAHNHLQQSGLGRVIGVDIVRTDKHIARELPKWTAENTALIRRTGGLSDKACDEIGKVVRDGFAAGTRHETLSRQIEQRLSVAKSRAVLIARDQTNKLNGQLTADRQVAAGVTHYVWSSARDERVRPSHRDLEGQVIAWADAPPEGHPGAPIQCRCVAIPTIVNARGFRQAPNVGARGGRVAGAATLPATTVFNPAKQPPATVAPTVPAWLTVPGQGAPAITPAAPATAAPPALSTLSLSASTAAERAAFFETEADEFGKILRQTSVADAIEQFMAPAGGPGLSVAQLDAAISANAAAEPAAMLLRQDLRRLLSRDAVNRYGLERLATTRTVNLKYVAPRAHFGDRPGYPVGSRDVINIGDGAQATVRHEAGHWIESRSASTLGDSAPDTAPIMRQQTSIIRQACTDFRTRRATSATPEALNQLTGGHVYGADEVALPDKFICAYVGKVYQSGDTEVFSLGLEQFSNTVTARDFVIKDKEHAGLILAILRGRVIP